MKVAISACLLGEPCRYDGEAKPCQRVIAFAAKHEVLPICPEVAGGLPTPRTPSEIVRENGNVRVMSKNGKDVTAAFETGSQETLRAMRDFGCELAVLKTKSPSCGTGIVYDGSFTGTLCEGWGVAAELIRNAGIPVESEESKLFD